MDKDRVGVTESYSSEWIDLINRGGLVHVTEESHQLFISIDYNTRHHMCMEKSKSMDDGFQKHLTNMIATYDDIQFNRVMTGVDNEDLLREIIALWITIRGPSFAKSVMEKYKLADKKSSEKSKGLCTRLFTEQL